MKGLRKVAFKILGPALVLTIVVMWACLPVYWGSCELAPLIQIGYRLLRGLTFGDQCGNRTSTPTGSL